MLSVGADLELQTDDCAAREARRLIYDAFVERAPFAGVLGVVWSLESRHHIRCSMAKASIIANYHALPKLTELTAA